MKLIALNLIIDIIWSKVETIPILVAKLLDLYYKLLITDPKFQKDGLKTNPKWSYVPVPLYREVPPSSPPGITFNKAMPLII